MKNKFHKTVKIQRGAKIGKGTEIWHNSQVLKEAEIGKGCTIGHNCFIGSGARLGNGVKLQSNIDIWDRIVLEDYVFVGPSAVFTNDLNPRSKYPKSEYQEYGQWLPTLVKKGSSIGANSTIICGVTVGSWSMIGAGAVVTKDIPDYAIAVGNPARVIGWVCECGNKLNLERGKSECPICHRKYKKEENKVWQE